MKLQTQDEPSSSFARSGNNLIYTHQISLCDSLNATPIQIKTLDGRTINLNTDAYITPQTLHLLKGEGMPLEVGANDELTRHLESFDKIPRGDMYVKFDIVFPNDLDSAKKQRILEILRQNREQLALENEDE